MVYSLENAEKFNWGSVTGDLNPERVSHLEKYLLGSRVLDAGCAGGAYASFLARQGYDVTGIDKHATFIDLAHEAESGRNWVQGNLISLPFANKTFDCTYCFDVLEHLDDRLAIKELSRVTTRRLILAVPQEDKILPRYNLTFLHYRDSTHLRYYTETSLRELVSTIQYSKLTVFPELAIPLKTLVVELVEFHLGMLTRIELELRSLKMRIQGTGGRHFLDMQNFKTIHTGLVAVVDL